MKIIFFTAILIAISTSIFAEEFPFMIGIDAGASTIWNNVSSIINIYKSTYFDESVNNNNSNPSMNNNNYFDQQVWP